MMAADVGERSLVSIDHDLFSIWKLQQSSSEEF